MEDKKGNLILGIILVILMIIAIVIVIVNPNKEEKIAMIAQNSQEEVKSKKQFDYNKKNIITVSN